jgi:purine-nucleoside phosphorylase
MQIHPYEAAEQAAEELRKFCPAPSLAIVLGSGLGAFASSLHDIERINYSALPHFPASKVRGHAGELVVGALHPGGPRIAALCGRSHPYEDLPASVIVHPTRAMWRWGVQAMVYTNAAGAIHPKLQPGDLMLIKDHINFTGRNPLIGEADRRLGERFVDMSEAYDPGFGAAFKKSAAKLEITLHQGVYLSLLGPSYETPAEIKAYEAIGADAVGMSTVMEVITARQAGMRVAGISCITNFGSGLAPGNLSHDEVKETAAEARERFEQLLKEGLSRITAELETQG